jgi:hypothetical protein
VRAPREFNWSRVNNIGAAARGNFLLFLYNDIQILADDWLARFCSLALLLQLGAVGALFT